MMFGNAQQPAGRKTWNKPIAGIGQGNGASLSIWATVSSPMFDIMHQDGFYALMRGAISHKEQKILGFVDTPGPQTWAAAPGPST